MSSPPQRRLELALFCLLAAGALLLGGLGLAVRLPEGADFAWKLAVNGPRLLLAAVVGAGLAVSGSVAEATRPRSLRDAYTLAVSFGAAFGATRSLTAGSLGPELGLGLGAAAGALLFGGVIAVLSRTRALAGVLVGLAMLAMAVAAVLAAVAAKGDPLGTRPLVWWMLGDFSRVRWGGACLAAAGILSLLATVLWRTPRRQGWHELEPARRRQLVMLGAVLWGVAIGAGGIIAWFGTLVALAARRLLRAPALRSWLVLSALLGALVMMGLDAGLRVLVAGYAFPIGVAVAMIAVPWFLAWGRLAPRPQSRTAALVMRSADFVLAGGVAALVASVLVVLTLVVRALG